MPIIRATAAGALISMLLLDSAIAVSGDRSKITPTNLPFI